MEEQKINLSLSLEMVNIIMASLGKMPYESVFAVVEAIRGQAGPQLQTQAAPTQ